MTEKDRMIMDCICDAIIKYSNTADDFDLRELEHKLLAQTASEKEIERYSILIGVEICDIMGYYYDEVANDRKRIYQVLENKESIT